MRRLGLAFFVAVFLAAGCSIPHPKESHGVTKIAASDSEVEQIYDRYRDYRKDALDQLDEAPLTAVETGSVLAIDTGVLRVARRLLLTKAPDDTQDLEIRDVYAPRLDAYPLWFVVVVEDGVRDLIKVQLFQRQTSTSPWLLVASPETLPSTELPAFDTDTTDALVSADPYRRGQLVMSPQKAVNAYAATLNAEAPPDDPVVSEDSFVTQMRAVANKQRQIEGVTFSQQWTARPVQYVLRAADGGVLVFGSLARVDNYQIEEGRYIDWPEGSEQKAFLSGRLYTSGELHYYHQILVYVPPEGDDKPVVLGQYGGVVDGIGY